MHLSRSTAKWFAFLLSHCFDEKWQHISGRGSWLKRHQTSRRKFGNPPSVTPTVYVLQNCRRFIIILTHHHRHISKLYHQSVTHHLQLRCTTRLPTNQPPVSMPYLRHAMCHASHASHALLPWCLRPALRRGRDPRHVDGLPHPTGRSRQLGAHLG